jgi:hypothetical protein
MKQAAPEGRLFRRIAEVAADYIRILAPTYMKRPSGPTG